MPQVQGQSFTELQYIALSLVKNTVAKTAWDEFKPIIEVMTQTSEDTKTVLRLLDQMYITVTFSDGNQL